MMRSRAPSRKSAAVVKVEVLKAACGLMPLRTFIDRIPIREAKSPMRARLTGRAIKADLPVTWADVNSDCRFP